MTDETTNQGNATGHGSFERRDIGAAGIIYFLVGLAVVTILIHFLLVGLFDVFDKREQARQPVLSPLVKVAPTPQTRQQYEDYNKATFPEPRLETDERNQLNQIRLREDEILNSYGWVDENAGTVRIPIDRAMALIAERGLPVRPEAASAPAAGVKKGSKP